MNTIAMPSPAWLWTERGCQAGVATTSWAVPLLSYAMARHPARTQTEKSHTNRWWAATGESVPPSTWTQCGQTPALLGIV